MLFLHNRSVFHHLSIINEALAKTSNTSLDQSIIFDTNAYKDLARKSIAFYMGVFNINMDNEVLDYLVNLIVNSVSYTTVYEEQPSSNDNFIH